MLVRTWILRLAAAALLPVLLSGCDVPEALGGKGSAKEADQAAEPAAGWIVVKQGAKAPEKTAPKAVPTPSATVPPAKPAAAPAPAQTGRSTDLRCSENYQPGKIDGLDTTIGSTSATVRWLDTGDKSVLTYRVTSISQQLNSGAQPPLVWQEVKPAKGCAMLSAVITGLKPKTPYMFSVDIVRATSWQNGLMAATVARSPVIKTL
ncbi:hypothetical protein [Actinoplanes sp. NPDC051859]|uniref:hypothetical protein n=1 Tax=Actinoplanes sp. NPDC051859 TaxID=3363909 RepID=UPI0037AEAA8B